MYNIGTWELPSLATDKLNPAVRDDIDFFTLPTTQGSVTSANEFVSPSGIGMAVNSKTYDPLVSDFLKFALKKYPTEYAATGALSPPPMCRQRSQPTRPPCTRRPRKRPTARGQSKPCRGTPSWTRPPTAGSSRNSFSGRGNITPEQFTSTMDDTIKQNAPKFFK